ncbi:lactate dehydrogenase [Sinanaerobacter chloroacetimidivorans]|uniref:Lactate dehydrogenase n=1 Tax=Sinanaerobacter chloroacetimidivorans TaxID=2818044 RepID=A0A8J7W478_9FIRM|nr:lactate dehydrogenase [Sinanaerobacter chloroacetimidivorans]MBR0598905.1 lactate dehydrogenase [Sinanaerobacter chloroacetimidivorans]
MYVLDDLIKGKSEVASKEPLFEINKKKRVNLLGLGDVGGTLLTGLKLLGGDTISSIGVYNGNQNVAKRYEYEMNQTAYPWDYDRLPEIEIIGKEQLFECDVFIFCASKSVPAVGDEVSDVRMVQFEANRNIIKEYAVIARNKKFKGLFAVVSDPVDPLCREAFLESNKNEQGIFDWNGLKAEQIQGYGLGVMNSRAAYYAKREDRFTSFLKEGRAFGPHGQDLVIANSIENYDDALSRELTALAVNANMKTREIGFKPYIAPALSSGAISLLLTMRGEWHYSSNSIGGIYLGAKNRMTETGVEIERIPLPEKLFKRIEHAYRNLEQIK